MFSLLLVYVLSSAVVGVQLLELRLQAVKFRGEERDYYVVVLEASTGRQRREEAGEGRDDEVLEEEVVVRCS